MQSSNTSLSECSPSPEMPIEGAPRDFCNSFWGQGDSGFKALLSRMETAMQTTNQLKHFWTERALIEEQYAARLATLAEFALGGDEIGELRNSLSSLLLETEKQAASHAKLASSIRSFSETETMSMYAKQATHKRVNQDAVKKKLEVKQVHETHVAKAQEKIDEDHSKIQACIQQCATVQGTDLELAEVNLSRAREIAQADEIALSSSMEALIKMGSTWEASWKDFCDSCQDLEESRIEFVKGVLWDYANAVSTVCVDADTSCECIRTTLEELEPTNDVQNFVVRYGTGSLMPATIAPASVHDSTDPPRLIKRSAAFTRISTRVTRVATRNSFSSDSTPPPSYSGPQQESLEGLSHKEKDHDVKQSKLPIKFCVKALYNYKATIDEEFDFEAGDIITVMTTPEDGWWTGELLDETRRREGKCVFPSNFVVPIDSNFQIPSQSNGSTWGCSWPLRLFTCSSSGAS